MAYKFLMNGECEGKLLRYKWVSLGRTQVSTSSNGIDELGRMFTWGRNYGGDCGQGDPEYMAWNTFGKGELVMIECATQLGSDTNWVKACSGEYSTVALNSNNELWGWGSSGYDCSAFGLPIDSGTGRKGWNGIPDPGKEYYFFTPIRVAPSYNFKDVAHDYYHTVAIGMDNKLYTFGYNGDYALGAGVAKGDNFYEPILNPTLTDDIKLIDCELLRNVAVTVDDRVFVWGTWSGGTYEVPVELPKEAGLVMPSDTTIIDCSISGSNSLYLVLSNGDVWCRYVSEIKKHNSLSAMHIVKVKTTAVGSRSTFVIDINGNIYGYVQGDPDWYTGNTIPPTGFTWNLIGSDYAGQRKFIDMVNNTYNQTYQAIDDQGYLYTWGAQWWATHLAICAKGTSTLDNYEPYITDVVDIREIAGLAAGAVDAQGNSVYLNEAEEVSALRPSEYVQSLPQTLRHKPCGHWHLRDFEDIDKYPANCWMPSIAIRDNNLLFIASGAKLKKKPNTGNEIIMFIYDMDANIWTELMRTSLIKASGAPGGAAIDTGINAFANWKADVSGTLLNEVYTNKGVGVWVVHSAALTLNYVEFLDSVGFMYMQNKLGVHSSGLVALIYNSTIEGVIVKVSTDFGVTYNTVKIVPTAGDYSLVVDDNGYIYIVYQVSSTSITVERSIDNGLNWVIQSADSPLLPGIEKIKLNLDNGEFFVFVSSANATAVTRSHDNCVTFTIPLAGPGYTDTITAHACHISDNHDDVAVVMTEYPGPNMEGILHNFIYDFIDEGYGWFERDISQFGVGGSSIRMNIHDELSVVEGYNGRFVYSSYYLYTVVDPYVAIAISVDHGQHWDIRATPLSYYYGNEIGNFQGCPLFCLTDVPYLNHIWKFEKVNDSENWVNGCGFVKQKDKYEKELICNCNECVKTV